MLLDAHFLVNLPMILFWYEKKKKFFFERLVCVGAMYLFLMHFKANKQAWSNEVHRKIIKDVKSE